MENKIIRKFIIGNVINDDFKQVFAFFANTRKEARKTFKSYVVQNSLLDYGKAVLKVETWKNNEIIKAAETIAEIEPEYGFIYVLFEGENGARLETIEYETHNNEKIDVVCEYAGMPETLAIYSDYSNNGGFDLLYSAEKEILKEAYEQYSKRALTAWVRHLQRVPYSESTVYYFPLFVGRDDRENHVFAAWEKDESTGEISLIARIGDISTDAMIIDSTDFDIPLKDGKDPLEISENVHGKTAAEIAKTFNDAVKKLVEYKWGYTA